jgi:hypothetical protein
MGWGCHVSLRVVQTACTSVNTVSDILNIIHRRDFTLTQRFGDWILSPSSGKSLLTVGPNR